MDDLSPPVILVVDDEPRVVEFITEVLAHHDCRLESAANGVEGLALAESVCPDLILLDVMMPEMDGFEVCRALRAHPVLAEVPIIMITALNDRQSRLEGLDAGADEFITKPLDVQELRTRVRVVLQLNRFKKQLSEQRKFSRLVTLSPDAILVLDREFNIRFVNPAAERIFRASPELELSATPLHMLLLGDEEVVLQQLRRVLDADAGTRLGDVRMLRLDGGEVEVDMSAGVIPWEDRPGVLLSLRDVTEQRRLERDFLRVQRLDGLGGIAGKVAHDLNNLLVPIQLAAQSLRVAELPADQQRIIATIAASAKRGSDVVRQIMAFTRGEDERRPVSLRETVEDTVQLFAEGLAPAIDLHLDLGASPAWVVANPTELHQLLSNLIRNATEAMPQGGLLSVTLDETADGRAVVAISDTGVGMDGATRAELGRPFFTTKTTGTGLGFASVRRIVDRHQGSIRIDSAPGEGTRITVEIPVCEHSGKPVSDAAPPPVAGDVSVLLIESDEAVRQLAAEVLSCRGHRVIEAAAGGEGVAVYRRQQSRIDLVICSHAEPLLDAGAVFESLRKLNPNVRLLMIAPAGCATGRADWPVLQEPFDREQLLKAVALAMKSQNEDNVMREDGHD